MESKYRLREVNSKNMRCVIGACPAIYVEEDNYFIIGKWVDPAEAGTKKVEEEVLIRVSRELIDDTGK